MRGALPVLTDLPAYHLLVQTTRESRTDAPPGRAYAQPYAPCPASVSGRPVRFIVWMLSSFRRITQRHATSEPTQARKRGDRAGRRRGERRVRGEGWGTVRF